MSELPINLQKAEQKPQCFLFRLKEITFWLGIRGGKKKGHTHLKVVLSEKKLVATS